MISLEKECYQYKRQKIKTRKWTTFKDKAKLSIKELKLDKITKNSTVKKQASVLLCKQESDVLKAYQNIYSIFNVIQIL